MPKEIARFKIPKNYVPPEEIEEGKDFRQLATFRLKGDDLCLVAIGDAPSSYEEDDDDEDYVARVARKSREL